MDQYLQRGVDARLRGVEQNISVLESTIQRLIPLDVENAAQLRCCLGILRTLKQKMERAKSAPWEEKSRIFLECAGHLEHVNRTATSIFESK
jgi:hypothetical protein